VKDFSTIHNQNQFQPNLWGIIMNIFRYILALISIPLILFSQNIVTYSPDSFDLSREEEDDAKRLIINIFNQGTEALVISWALDSSGAYSFSSGSKTIAPQSSHVVEGWFAGNRGTYEQYLIFTHNFSSSPDSIKCIGTVNAYVGLIGSLAFGNILISTTIQQDIYAEPLGLYPITISDITSSNPDFTVFPTNFYLDQSDPYGFITVTFTPQEKNYAGEKITVYSDATNSPAFKNLSGIGVLNYLTFNQDTLDFGMVSLEGHNEFEWETIRVTHIGLPDIAPRINGTFEIEVEDGVFTVRYGSSPFIVRGGEGETFEIP